MLKNQINTEQKMILILIFGVAVFYLLPFVLFGTNSIIAIHDNLDHIVPYYKMFHDNELFFKFDVPTKGFSEMSTLYYSQLNFNFQNVLYMIFSDFTAYTFSYYFSIIIGCISMYILLRKIFGISKTVSILTAICYAILPVIPVWNIAVSTLPLIISVFCYFASRPDKVFSWKVLLLLFYPFFSFFSTVGIFILSFWFIGLIVLTIKNKRININLFIGFVLLFIGYILVDLRLFYVMFILKTPLNRSVYTIYHPDGIIAQLRTFLKMFKQYGINGYYHASSFQNIIIIPVIFLTLCFCLIVLIDKIRNQTGKAAERIKAVLSETDFKIKLLLLLNLVIVAFACIGALYESGLLNSFIKKFFPMLSGFNWGRVWIFNRVLWYIVFALCLQIILRLDCNKVNDINKDRFNKKVNISPILLRICVWVIILLQMIYIAIKPVQYNDPVKTWFNQIVIRTGIAKKLFPNKGFQGRNYISYEEFFAKDLFYRIKKDIFYSDEMVVALGYHPSVLMYNGFNCIDGYNNAYPLSYMQKFRTLIAPELEINQEAREYYDRWGGRMYLFNNSRRNYQPTRNKNTSPVTLNIDINVFKNDFNGKYILSRAEILNYVDLDLELVNIYYDVESIYTIYVYRVKS